MIVRGVCFTLTIGRETSEDLRRLLFRTPSGGSARYTIHARALVADLLALLVICFVASLLSVTPLLVGVVMLFHFAMYLGVCAGP